MGCRTLMCIWYKGKKRREKAKDENFPFAPTIYHHVPNWEKIDQLNRNASGCLGGNSLKNLNPINILHAKPLPNLLNLGLPISNSNSYLYLKNQNSPQTSLFI